MSSQTTNTRPDNLPPVTANAHSGGEKREEEEGGSPKDENCNEPSSPGVDVHAVLGLPRPKRPSERSEEVEEPEGSDTDDYLDSDDDPEEWQEGEYLVMEEDDEERKKLQIQMLSENASLSRDMLVPIFTACISAYDKWIDESKASVPEEEMQERRKQLGLYWKVLELYGSDTEWKALTHAQRVEQNKEARDVSIRAKELGQPPVLVSKASIAAGNKMASETFSADSIEKRIADSMKNLNL